MGRQILYPEPPGKHGGISQLQRTTSAEFHFYEVLKIIKYVEREENDICQELRGGDLFNGYKV